MKKLSREHFKETLFSRYLPLQILNLLFLVFLFYQKMEGKLGFYFYGLSAWLVFQLILTGFITRKIQSRLADLIGEEYRLRSTYRHIFTTFLMPHLIIWEIYLLIKFDQLKIGEFRKKLLPGFALIPLQLVLTIPNLQWEKAHHFISSQIGASAGYIATIAFEAEEVLAIGSTESENKSEKMANYLRVNDVTSTGLILSIAIFASDLHEKHQGKRDKESSKKVIQAASVETAHELIDKSTISVDKIKTLKSPITISRGLQLITPSSLVEIGLIELIDAKILLTANEEIQHRLAQLHKEVGKAIEKDEKLKSRYSDRHKELERKIASVSGE